MLLRSGAILASQQAGINLADCEGESWRAYKFLYCKNLHNVFGFCVILAVVPTSRLVAVRAGWQISIPRE